ncbi:MAG: DUF3617 family protein [Reyranella sp.]|jgi:hypothetical protein|uniref:DUF3617 domain-containing protein n=1 Tax=Reyranella sp. TaxID=1929291 RepID=UPI0025FB2ED0|nr:DUF3617 family protein [Reyranella sp.]MBR2813123.1 DUF3617 family protein [Reyranella sp.]
MKQLGLTSIAIALTIFGIGVGAARAETPIQAGEWESTEKTTMEGVQPMPATSKKTCLKGDDAKLERLLFPTPDEIKQHNCKYEEGAKKAGVLSATLVCPPSDVIAGVTAKAEISYSATSYEGLGQIEAKDKSGTVIKGSSALSGKRLGDCP